ncbi:MAG: HEAT repeat domain-containing protein [Planctomycetes bacterium]|nr:HEAT repeat domain-containing protein [Planctomycetota bacterium]
MRPSPFALAFGFGFFLGTVISAQPPAPPAPGVPGKLPNDVAGWVQLLVAPSVPTRVGAIDSLAGAGVNAPQVVAGLAGCLNDDNEAVRWHAARALGAMGADASAAVPALAAKLADNSALVRAYCAYAIGRTGEAGKQAVPALVKCATDSDRLVRTQAIKAIATIRPGPAVSVPLFVDLLRNAPPEDIPPVLHSLASLGAPAVDALTKALDYKEARYWVCLVLAEIGPAARAATAKVLECTADADPLVRREALLCLGHMAAGPEVVPAIVKALDDSEESVRYSAGVTLGLLGPTAKSAASTLKIRRNANDPLMKTVAAWALTRVEPDIDAHDTEALPLLIESIKHQNPRVRAAAAHALGELDGLIAPMARATPLAGLLGDADAQVRMAAIEALISIGPQAIPALTMALQPGPARGGAAEVLSQLGPEAKSALPALNAALGDPAADIRAEVLAAIGAIGPEAGAMVSALSTVLTNDPSPMVRHNAAVALGSINPLAGKPALQKAAKSDADDAVRNAAQKALDKLAQ